MRLRVVGPEMSDESGSTSQPNGDASQEDAHLVRAGKSARLQIAAHSGDVAALREAMDPANQSLGEALRLSYRLLQIAILGLVVTFLFSGFQSVVDGVTGIRTIFGKVAGAPGDEALVPGLHPFWPYPVGEFVTLQQRQMLELRESFWPEFGQKDMTLEQATDSADPNNPIRPQRDGSILTSEGDLAHLQLSVEYSVADPVAMLGRISPESLDRVMQALLERAAVEVCAETSLSELLDQRETAPAEIRQRLQSSVDSLRLGIQIAGVGITERTAPLAVRNALRRVQTAREDAKTALEKARQEANASLVGAAGPQYAQVLELIGNYENLLTKGDQAGADLALQAIGQRLEQPDIGGMASRIIARAKAYQSSLEATLSNESRRVQSLAESYRQNPRQLVQKLWLEAVSNAMGQPEVEVFSVPPEIGQYVVRVKSSPDIMQTRRDSELARKKKAAEMIGMDLPSFQLGSRQIMIDKAGRRLDSSGQKGFGRE